MTTQVSAAGWRKMAAQALFGAAAGAGGMFAVMALMVGRDGPGWAPSQVILAAVGLIYTLMGLFVGLGTLAPRLFGQRLLNVADAEEIVEERSNMVGSALSCLVLGAALMLFADASAADASARTGLVSPAIAFWILMFVLAGFTAVSLWMWGNFDELWRQLTVEVSAITGSFLMITGIVWGGAAAAGLVAGPHPLDLVSLVFGTMLLACFVAVGRRGMMAPR